MQIQQETPTVKRFVFDLGQQHFNFLPGQWIDFYVEIEGCEQIGGYSLISAPQNTQGQIELAIKASPHHVVTRWLSVFRWPRCRSSCCVKSACRWLI